MRLVDFVVFVLATVSAWSSVAQAELEVIYDSGATHPLAPYLEAFGEPPSPAPAQYPSHPMDKLGAADPSRLLPIRSPGLTPGPVTRRSLSLPDKGLLSRPFFLVGAETRSRAWLARHRDRLESLGAVGMLVQAETVADLEAIARIANGLPVLPASASDIARSLGIRHVPVLISRRGIEQ